MKYFKSAFITFASNVFLFGASFIITIITSRLLGTTGRGVVSLVNNVVNFGVIILGFGLSSSNIFFIGKDRKKINEILGFNFIISLLSSFILIILYIINNFYNLNFLFKNLDNIYIVLALLFIPIMNIKTAFTSLFLGMQEVVYYNKINILDKSLNLILLILFIIPIRTAFVVLMANIISSLVIMSMLFYKLFIKNGNRIKIQKTFNKEILKYSLKSQLGNLIQVVNYRLDTFLVNYYCGISDVGIYANAVVLGETLWQIATSVATIVFPATASSKDNKSIINDINTITRITFYIIMLSSLALMVLSRFIVSFFGKGFKGTATALILLIPGIAIFSICKILSNYIAGIGMLEKNITASTISCIVTLVLDFTLIPKWGINGAAIASSISYILFTMITVYFYLDITHSKLKDIFVLTKDDIIMIKTKLIQLKSLISR